MILIPKGKISFSGEKKVFFLYIKQIHIQFINIQYICGFKISWDGRLGEKSLKRLLKGLMKKKRVGKQWYN